MDALFSRPVQRAWRVLPICPAGTRGRILKRRISHAHRTAAKAVKGPGGAVAQEAAAERVLLSRLNVPHMYRSNPALSFSLASPPVSSAGASSNHANLTYLHPQNHPPPIQSLLRAIDSRSPESIWHTFSALDDDSRPLLTPSILQHVFLSLRPKKHLPHSSRAYFDHYHPSYSPSKATIPLARLPKRQHAAAWLMSRVSAVLAEYRANSIPPGTPEYAHLLDLARATGNITMAKEVWAEMDDRGVRKDTKCYNTYIAALCGTSLTEATWKTDARTVGIRARRDMIAAATRRQESTVGDVSAMALRIFDTMLKEGLVPDMATFDFLLLAVARMGNLPVLKSLIWRCWGVDISSTTLTPPPSSPSSQPPLNLPPTPQTLTNLAGALSRLSHPSIAIRLVNHLSLTHSLPIPSSTWQQLLLGTYLSTRPPAHTRRLPEQTMANLWSVMRSAPYSIAPDLEMYDLIIRHHLRGQRYRFALQLIEEALAPKGPWDALNTRFRATRAKAEGEVGWGWLGRSSPAGLNLRGMDRRAQLPQLHKTTPLTTYTASLDLQVYRGRSLVARWLELLIYSPTYDDDAGHNWRRRRVPNLIYRYGREFLGGSVGYKIDGVGFVELVSTTGVLGLDVIPTEEQVQQQQVDLVPALGSGGAGRKLLPVHRQRESVRWRWKNRGVKYGEWREDGGKGVGEEAQGGEGVLVVDRTKLGPPERSVRLGFVKRWEGGDVGGGAGAGGGGIAGGS